MVALARPGLTAPAVASRGLSEGLGHTSLCEERLVALNFVQRKPLLCTCAVAYLQECSTIMDVEPAVALGGKWSSSSPKIGTGPSRSVD